MVTGVILPTESSAMQVCSFSLFGANEQEDKGTCICLKIVISLVSGSFAHSKREKTTSEVILLELPEGIRNGDEVAVLVHESLTAALLAASPSECVTHSTIQ